MRLNFDLMTGFSTVPVQLFSGFGIAISLLSTLLFVLFLVVRRIFVGSEAEGVFTLFAIAFFCIGMALFGDRTARRVRRADLRRGAASAALHRRARCWSSARVRSGDARSRPRGAEVSREEMR